MRLIREAKGHAEGVIVVLQEAVSIMNLVQFGYSDLELLQPCTQVLLGPSPTGQVGIHYPTQRDVVPYICTLREAIKIQTVITHIIRVLSDDILK